MIVLRPYKNTSPNPKFSAGGFLAKIQVPDQDFYKIKNPVPSANLLGSLLQKPWSGTSLLRLPGEAANPLKLDV